MQLGFLRMLRDPFLLVEDFRINFGNVWRFLVMLKDLFQFEGGSFLLCFGVKLWILGSILMLLGILNEAEGSIPIRGIFPS